MSIEKAEEQTITAEDVGTISASELGLTTTEQAQPVRKFGPAGDVVEHLAQVERTIAWANAKAESAIKAIEDNGGTVPDDVRAAADKLALYAAPAR